MESLLIKSDKCDHLLNGKGEWWLNLLPRHKPTEEKEALPNALTDISAKRKIKIPASNTEASLAEFPY